MQFITGKKYRATFNKLPQEVQDVISTDENWEKIHEIGTAHKLHIDSEGQLINMTIDVMMGFIPGNEFSHMICKEIGIEKNIADQIVHDIDEKIFKPIKQKMIDLYGEKGEKTKNAYDVSEYDPHAEEDHSDLTRNDVLKEIEQPFKTGAVIKNVPTFSAAVASSVNLIKPAIAKPIPVIEFTETEPAQSSMPAPTTSIASPTSMAPIGFTKDFLADKTKKSVVSGVSINNPTSNVVAENLKANKFSAEPAKHSDPYREPIN